MTQLLETIRMNNREWPQIEHARGGPTSALGMKEKEAAQMSRTVRVLEGSVCGGVAFSLSAPTRVAV
jgi:hypothetical protein